MEIPCNAFPPLKSFFHAKMRAIFFPAQLWVVWEVLNTRSNFADHANSYLHFSHPLYVTFNFSLSINTNLTPLGFFLVKNLREMQNFCCLPPSPSVESLRFVHSSQENSHFSMFNLKFGRWAFFQTLVLVIWEILCSANAAPFCIWTFASVSSHTTFILAQRLQKVSMQKNPPWVLGKVPFIKVC